MVDTGTFGPASTLLTLAQAIGETRTIDEIHALALDALADAVAVERSSVLLFDADGVMRFKASRGLSAAYRAAVEGHSPWTPRTTNATPIVLPDVETDAGLAPYLAVIRSEGIRAMAFIPLQESGRVIGKFMLYFAEPRELTPYELQVVTALAAQVAFALVRTRAEERARRSEERLLFALDAASMGTWDWDLVTNQVVWSENLERIHGLPPGTFDGTFASYEREIHPDDRARVLQSAERAMREGTPHDVEYRIVAPDGTVRWCEGKGRVEFEGGIPIRMSGVCMIVTRRKEAELARLAAAEEASRLKDEFLATLSHELRTPLNAVLGWTQLLQHEQLNPDRARHAVEVIARNAQLQGQLIDEILDVSRIITGKLHIERRPVAVGPLVQAAVAGISPVARARGLSLSQAVASDRLAVAGDPQRLHQVLGNVLSNAVKFTPAGGSISVTCELRDRAVSITVADTGTGIDPAFLPYVFDRFRQADSRTTRQHGGLGLGLAIARYLVEQHDGSIRAESRGHDTGTTIVITLPCEAVAESGVSPHLATDRLRLDGRIVMVVDDQVDSCDMLASLIESRGATAVRCTSALEALDVLAGMRVDLLIADIAMPQMDGYELISRLRASNVRLPAIAVTAFARPDDEARARSAGFDAHAPKPIDAAQLLAIVARLMTAEAAH